MPDIYDEILDNQALQPVTVASDSTPAPDVYDRLLDQQQSLDDRAVQSGIEQAAKVPPARAAQVQSLAKSSGLPASLVERNFDQVQRRDKALKMRSVVANSPVLARQLRAPEFAGVAYDDLENLAAIERTIATHGELKAPTGPAPSFGSVMSDLGQSFVNAAQSAREGIRLEFADVFGFEAMQRDAQRRAAGIAMQGRLSTPEFESSTAQGLYGGAASVLQMVPAVAASIFTGNPFVGLGIMGVQTQAQAYPKYRLRGASPGMAALGAGGEGAIEVATEMLPMSFLVKNLGKTGIGEFLSGMLGREVLTEQTATVLQDAVDTAVANPDKTWAQYAAERPDAAYQTLLGSLLASGVFGGMNVIARRMGTGQQVAQLSEEGTQLIERINELAAASELQKIDADTFEQFVEQAAEVGPVQDVYIDANTLMQSGLADELAAVSPAVAEQYEQALQTGGVVRIPVAEYAARIAPTDFAQPLLDHLRVDPAGMSRAEAKEYMATAGERLQQEIASTLAANQIDEAARASADAVRDNIKGQLDTAKRFTPQVNEAYATLVGEFYANTAARTGMTAQDVFDRYPLRVVAESVAGGQQFDQAALKKAKDAIGGLLAQAKQPGNKSEKVTLSAVQDWLVDLAQSSGIDIGGYNHIIDSSSVRHVRKQHGDAATEETRGQIAVTDEDFAMIPDVLARPDKVVFGTKNRLGKDQIVYLKTLADGSTLYLEEIRTGKKELAAQSMRRYPATMNAESILSTLNPNAESDGGNGLIVMDPSSAGNAFQQNARGFFSPETNTIGLLKAADLSTFLHESGHFFLEVQMDLAAQLVAQQREGASVSQGEQEIVNDAQALLNWFGVADFATWYNLDFEEKRSYHEQFARGFEAYLFEGNAPSIEVQGIFQRFRSWLVSVYKKLQALNVELTDEVRSVMDRMLASDEQIKAAQYARSMMPLFESPEQAGMTPEEFAAYQSLGQDATQDAQAQLTERGLRDMQWMHNAKARVLKRLQKEAEGLRNEERIEARREIMSQPVFRAWQFLTGRVSRDDRVAPTARAKSDPNVVDPSQDSLFVAIAKLGGIQREQAQSEWGVDPTEKIGQPVFGKPVLRKIGGLSIDEMRQALAQHGYLNIDHQDPNWDPNEFEWKFFDELGGSPTYSNQFDYAAAQQEDIAGQGVNLENVLAGRLSRRGLRDMYGDGADAVWKALDARRMVVNDGLHPDLVAELFGFTSGDELVQALARAQPPELEIEALTDLRMLEKHGDLASPEALARAADWAIHNELRARVIAAEHKALADAVGPRVASGVDQNGRARSTALVPQAAREFAKMMVARLKIRNLRPGQYAAAESRAGKAAEKALRSSDLEQAAAEKRNQLVNHYAAKAAYDAIDEVNAGIRYLKKFDSEGTRKSLDIDYLEQIDAMLARFDLRRGQSLKAIDKRTSLADWIEARNNEGTEPDIPPWLAAEANRDHYKNLTLEEFRGLVDAVKQIEHLGRLKHQLLTAQDKRALDAIVAELRDSINANANGRVKDNERRNTVASTAAHALRGFLAAHRKVANLAREMDGFKDGGPLWEFIIRPMNDAGNKEASMRADASKRLYELSKPILADGKMGGKGVFFPTVNRSFNRGERIAIALNWGNEGNRQRLLDGRGWTVDQLRPVLATLTAKEWTFVQGVWDFFESYRPEIAAKERRVMGKEPDWIEATPLTVHTADGQDITLRGGYYPVKYDPNQSGEAGAHADAEQAKAMMRAAYTAATTRRSFTKSRAEAVKGRPLLLTFDGIYRGANEVIHDLAWHEWLIDVNKLLRRLDGPIRNGYGAETATAIKRTVEDIARGDTPASNAVEASFNHLRTGATVAGLGWNIFTGLLQPLGITQSFARVGPAWVARGLREFYGNPTQTLAKIEEVNAQSEFMRNRARTLNREINDVQNQLTKSKPAWRTFMESSFFVFIQKLQMTVDYPTWLGAYGKALQDPRNHRDDGTVDEGRAARMADQAVIDAQGEGQMKDLSQVQRGNPMFKLFTNFYSYFNTAMNLATDSTKRTNFKDPVQVAHLAGDYLLIMVLPAVLGALLRAGLKGGGDDDDLLKRIAEEQIDYLMGMFVGLREVSSAVKFATGVGNPAFGYSGPAGARFFSEVTRLGQQIGQGQLDAALLKSTNNVAGLIFHYPAGQVARSVEGAAALIEGRTKNPLAPLLGAPRP